MPTVQMGVSTEARDLGPLARRLRKAGTGTVLNEVQRRWGDQSSFTASDLRAAALRVRVTSTKGGHARPDRSTGLRRTTAAAVGVSSWTPRGATGVRIAVSATKMRAGGYPGDLSKYLDSTIGNYSRWAHPVFGQMTVWTVQRGSPWFFSTIKRHFGLYRKGVINAMRAVRNNIVS